MTNSIDINANNCKRTEIFGKNYEQSWFEMNTFPIVYKYLQCNSFYPFFWKSEDEYVLFDNMMEFIYREYPEYKILYMKEIEFDFPEVLVIALKDNLYIRFSFIEKENLNGYVRYDRKDGVKFSSGEELVVSNIDILYDFVVRDEVLGLKDVIKDNMVVIDDSQTNIGLISFDSGDYYVKEIDITKNLGEWHNLDLHYPDDGEMKFTEFYEGLKEKLLNTQKGLVLLFGSPGTGKSHFIRHIIHDVSNVRTKDDKKKKFFIYVPPNLIPNILEPNFITFLTDYVIDTEREIILVMEDAEQVLAKREYGNSGAANILNLTDGILNDILGFQVIATFNTALDDIDDALLRDGRLIARKKFSALSEKDAKKLIEAMKLDIKVTNAMTLAEIYTKKERNEILQHNITSEEEKCFGFVI